MRHVWVDHVFNLGIVATQTKLGADMFKTSVEIVGPDDVKATAGFTWTYFSFHESCLRGPGLLCTYSCRYGERDRHKDERMCVYIHVYLICFRLQTAKFQQDAARHSCGKICATCRPLANHWADLNVGIGQVKHFSLGHRSSEMGGKCKELVLQETPHTSPVMPHCLQKNRVIESSASARSDSTRRVCEWDALAAEEPRAAKELPQCSNAEIYRDWACRYHMLCLIELFIALGAASRGSAYDER